MAYELSYRDNGFFLTHRGRVDVAAINAVNGLIHGHKEFDHHRFQLIDLLDADFSAIPVQDAMMPAATDTVASRMCHDVQVAMVVADEAAREFCNRYVETARMLESGWQFRIFDRRKDALEWIGLGGGQPA